MSADLTALFISLAMPADLASEPKLTKRLYADALANLPEADAREVLRLYRIGELGDGKWCPKPAEIRRTVLDRIARRADIEKQDRIIRETLEARRADLGPREELPIVSEYLAHLDALAPDGERAWRPPTQDEARDWTEAYESGGVRLSEVTISDRLAENLEGLASKIKRTA